MNEGEIDNMIDFLWQHYQTDDDSVNGIITGLLHDLRKILIDDFIEKQKG